MPDPESGKTKMDFFRGLCILTGILILALCVLAGIIFVSDLLGLTGLSSFLLIIPPLILYAIGYIVIEGGLLYSSTSHLRRKLARKGWNNLTLDNCLELEEKFEDVVKVLPPVTEFFHRDDFDAESFSYLKNILMEIRVKRLAFYQAKQHQDSLLIAVIVLGIPLLMTFSIILFVFFEPILVLKLMSGFIAIACLIYLLFVYRIKLILKSKGYHWACLGASAKILYHTGWRAKKLPSHHVALSILEFQDYDYLSIIWLLKKDDPDYKVVKKKP